MKLKLNRLEKKFLGLPHPDLARGALVVSGVTSLKILNLYMDKLQALSQKIAPEIPETTDMEKARMLFDWLWHQKPDRYEPGGNYLLTEVLDAQLNPDIRKVGNCLGLTLLYQVLSQRFGLQVEAAHVEDAAGKGPHVFSILHLEHKTLDLEHVLPHGFGFKGHLQNLTREKWNDAELIADIYHSRGNSLFEQKHYEEAVQIYGKALYLNPRYTRAQLNRALALSVLGREKEAIKAFEQA